MKIFLIQTTFALPIWYRLSNPGEGWDNGNQFNSELEKPLQIPASDFKTATMGGFVASNGDGAPSVGEPVQPEGVNASADGDSNSATGSDARIVSFLYWVK